MRSLPRTGWKGRSGDGEETWRPQSGFGGRTGSIGCTITDIITKGKNKMPAFDGKLTKEQIGQVLAYIRELGKKH